jgi:hypothetical protein
VITKKCKLFRCPYYVNFIHKASNHIQGSHSDDQFSENDYGNEEKEKKIMDRRSSELNWDPKQAQRLAPNLLKIKDSGAHEHDQYEEEYKIVRRTIYTALDSRNDKVLPPGSVKNENLPCLTSNQLRNLCIKEGLLKGEMISEERTHLTIRAMQCFKQRDINRSKGKTDVRKLIRNSASPMNVKKEEKLELKKEREEPESKESFAENSEDGNADGSDLS